MSITLIQNKDINALVKKIEQEPILVEAILDAYLKERNITSGGCISQEIYGRIFERHVLGMIKKRQYYLSGFNLRTIKDFSKRGNFQFIEPKDREASFNIKIKKGKKIYTEYDAITSMKIHPSQTTEYRYIIVWEISLSHFRISPASTNLRLQPIAEYFGESELVYIVATTKSPDTTTPEIADFINRGGTLLQVNKEKNDFVSDIYTLLQDRNISLIA